MTTEAAVWLATVLALDGLTAIAGAALSDRWLRGRVRAFVGFAAGALLAAAFLDALPEAASEAGVEATAAWMFAGFIAAGAVAWALGRHTRRHGPAGSEGSRVLPPVLLASDGLHNVADGAAIAAAFLASRAAGVGVAIAVIAHELPQEIGDYALLRRAGWPRLRALAALGAVQLTAVAGAVFVVVAGSAATGLSAVVLAFSAGSFLHIGATDLLPELRAEATVANVAGFVLGASTVVLAGALVGPG